MKPVQTIQASRKQIIAVIGFLFLLFGGVFSTGVFWWVKGAQSATWLPVSGRVEETCFFRGSGKGRGLFANARCSYSIQGDNLSCSKLCYGLAGEKDTMFIRRQGIGDAITVWVNQENHEEAVLIPGVMLGTKLLTGATLIVLLCLGYALAKTVRMREIEPPSAVTW